jgi:uncharacterized damage-inducible protein DinB
MNDDLSALFAYNRWADDRVVTAIRQLTPEQYTQEPVPGWASVRSSLVHIAAATALWARRLQGEDVRALATEADVPNLDDAVRLLAEGHDAFDRLLAAATPEKRAAIWTARDPKGNERKMPYWAAYRHVVNHATYHRGQIASKLRRLGVTTPFTDLVLWAVERTAKEGK